MTDILPPVSTSATAYSFASPPPASDEWLLHITYVKRGLTAQSRDARAYRRFRDRRVSKIILYIECAEEVSRYYGIVPLDSPTHSKDTVPGQAQAGGIFGYRNWVYKAFSDQEAKPYILRRLEGFRLQHESALAVVEKWRRIRHPNIVSVREAFTTKGFGDNCKFTLSIV